MEHDNTLIHAITIADLWLVPIRIHWVACTTIRAKRE